jgi:hypothetical protein
VKAIFVELQEHQNRFERRYHPSSTLRLLFLFDSFRWAGDFFAGFLDDFVAVFAFIQRLSSSLSLICSLYLKYLSAGSSTFSAGIPQVRHPSGPGIA